MENSIQNPDTNDDQIIIEFDDFHDFLADSFDNKENNENQENRENLEFKFSCIMNITWVYHCKYESKKEKSETFYYYCSQKDCLKQKSNKDSNSNKHRDKRSMERFACTWFLTELWNILQDSQFKIREIGVDATYNTNNLKFELYVVHAEVDGIGVPLAYLFIENNGNCGNGVRTGVIIDFLVQLKTRGLKPDFFITDKDFAQISAARFVWNGIKVQLCLWHIKKAIEARLANNKKPQQINYNVFCPKEMRPLIWKMMNNHLHKHPLIPTIDGQFLSSASIWKMAVEEIYNFCKQNSLPWLWAYLWNEWYNADHWFLCFRAGCGDKLSIFKTNMFVEAHWKVLKRDFLYKFFRPRLDLVIFVIMEQVVPHNKRKFEQIFVVKREKADWRKAFKENGRSLQHEHLIIMYILLMLTIGFVAVQHFLLADFLICKHLIQKKGNVAIQFFDEVHRHYQYPFLNMLPIQIDNFRIFITRFEDFEGDNIFEANNLQACEELYNRLVDTTEKVLEILKDQQSKRNLKWAKGLKIILNHWKKCCPKSQYINEDEQCLGHLKIIRVTHYFSIEIFLKKSAAFNYKFWPKI
ncbi:unnamed protein product [Rhizophagus irregularis]|nr:unnamed protein product [Rhizophagus irregularis]